MNGQAIAVREASRDRHDLYIDYLSFASTASVLKTTLNTATTVELLPIAQQFAQKNPSARFALLRLWSAPHFYLIVLDPEDRNKLAFPDVFKERKFASTVVPKDMSFSEKHVHETCSERIKPYKKLFGDRVVVKKDLYLVMGEDEEDLMKIATATVFAVERKPWKLEIDLWKSLVNVDNEFLKKNAKSVVRLGDKGIRG